MTFDGRILSGVSVLATVVDRGSFVKAARLLGIVFMHGLTLLILYAALRGSRATD